MKIMITGGMGFIGSNLCELLLSKKHNVIIITKSFSKKQNVSNIYKKLKIEKIDVTNFKKLGESIKRNINKKFSFTHLINRLSNSLQTITIFSKNLFWVTIAYNKVWIRS